MRESGREKKIEQRERDRVRERKLKERNSASSVMRQILRRLSEIRPASISFFHLS